MTEQSIQDNEKEDLYPWLHKDDPHRDMTDEEILDKYKCHVLPAISLTQVFQFYSI